MNFVKLAQTNPMAPLLVLVVIIVMSCSQNTDHFQSLIQSGEYSQAQAEMRRYIARNPDLSHEDRLSLEFEIARLDRIRQDFTATEEEVREYVRQYIPEASQEDFRRWESSQALEWRMIDGEKRYFVRAGRNFFRIDADARKIWQERQSTDEAAGSGEAPGIDDHNAEIIAAVENGAAGYIKPVRIRVTQSITVDAEAVPAGEITRAWIPYPRIIAGRQDQIDLIRTEPEQHIVAPADQLQRTIYFEKPAGVDEATEFNLTYEYTTRGRWVEIDPGQIKPVAPDQFTEYLKERPPHIVFTPELRKLSQQIVGSESNPYLMARRLFEWVDTNIPWASAREYSTIPNIPQYAIDNKHGDCGIQGLLFITLCRLNGIPARWQSGWEFKPPDDSMHDWGMIYFEPYGWLPMDVTYGVRKVDDERGKWFYLSGMDSYRTVFNDDFSRPFFPAKIHHRSETVDSQRGEVEWRGGNLYFDQWSWSHEWQIIDD